MRKGFSKAEKHLENKSWNTPKGYQLFFRENETEILAVIHTFENSPAEIEFNLVENIEIKAVFKAENIKIEISENGRVKVKNLEDFTGLAILFKKN